VRLPSPIVEHLLRNRQRYEEDPVDCDTWRTLTDPS